MSVSKIIVNFDVPMQMRDGTLLYANIFRPESSGLYPVALNRTPYSKDQATSFQYLDIVRLAQAGYIVVVQDVRGRFRSAGEWEIFTHEVEDGYDSVEWAARMPGSNGKVGLWGFSYLGYTQWAATAKRPPHLKTIMPAFTWSDARKGMLWRGGAFELGLFGNLMLPSLGADSLMKRAANATEEKYQTLLKSFIHELDFLPKGGYSSLPLQNFSPLKSLNLGMDLLTDLIEHPNDAKFSLSPFSARGWVENNEVPSFNIGGWYDIFLQGTLDNFSLLQEQEKNNGGSRSKLLIGPWSHITYGNVIGDIDFGAASQMGMIEGTHDLVELTGEWFDFWLKDSGKNVLETPPIKLFVMGTNTWRNETKWPLSQVKSTSYYLQPENGLAANYPPAGIAPDSYLYDPANPVPTLGGNIHINHVYGVGAKDQRAIESRQDVLSFTTGTLEAALEVIGPVKAFLWAASSAKDTDFIVRLVDVYPDGFAHNLADGIIRARYRNAEKEELLVPDQPYLFEIDLWSTANVFLAGHRIRLDITSSCFPRWDRNLNTGEAFGTSKAINVARQIIFHDADRPSHIDLPVIRQAG